tara:strand:+ start:6370 stop:8859 length:2490 start_codon:yes stop_codon:yes gene_type:complete
MFNNRAYTEITQDELANTEMALAKLDAAYQSNRMTKGMYLSRRERLVKNLERVLSSPTPLATNPTAYFGRDELNLSPRPVGYQDSLEASQELDGPQRKASQSKIRQAALQNAYSDVDTASIMDALQENTSPSNFSSALTAVNDIQTSQLLGTKRREPTQAQLAGVWADIANSPGVINALNNLSDSVRTRVDAAIASGLPVSAAENYILSNARNAGAALTKEGYDRQRAAEVVKSVINGELSIIAAQNIVSGDLREATRAVVSNEANFAVDPTVSPNAAKVNTEKMSINEIVEVRNAALDTLADPLAFQEELEWAASFVDEANQTLNQRLNQTNVVTGNSAHQIKISTEPGKKQTNQGDGLPMPIGPKPMPIIQEPPATVAEVVQNIPALNLAEVARKKEAEAAKKAAEKAALKAAAEAAMKEAQEKALKAAANKAKKEANALARKKANDARRAREASEKKRLEEEARQAKLLAQKKEREEREAAEAAKKAAEAKRLANEAARKIAANKAAAEKKKLANLAAKKAAANKAAAEKKKLADLAAKKAAEEKKLKALAAKEAANAKKAANLAAKKAAEEKAKAANLAAKKAAAEKKKLANLAAKKEAEEKKLAEQAMKASRSMVAIEPTIQFAVMPNIPMNTLKKSTKDKVKNAIPKRTPLTKVNKPAMVEFAESITMLPSKPGPIKTSVSKPMVKPGPIKTSVSKPMVLKEFNKPQKVTTKQIKKPAPINKRTPSQKVANALARLPSQKNVDNVVKTLPTKEQRRIANEVKKYKAGGRRPILGSTTTSTSTSHDPRDKFRDAGLGASTSTTTSSRTSGAYRFDDPRLMHRWG